MAEDALKSRRTAKNTFTRKKNKFYAALARKEHFSIVEGNFKELTYAWHTVEGKHENYTTLLENDNDADASEAWIAELEEIYDEAESPTGSALKNIPLRKKKKKRAQNMKN